MAKDPVCGKEIREDTWLEEGHDRLKLEGKTYYFCGLVCRQKFVANPKAYVGEESQA